MSEPTKTLGHGCILKRGGTKVTYKIISITPPSLKVGVVEASNMDSVDYKEKIVEKLADSGQVACKIEFDGTYPTDLGEWDTTIVELPSGKSITVDAAIIEFSPDEVTSTDGMQASMVLECRGAVTIGTVAG